MKILSPEVGFREDRYATRIVHDEPAVRVVAFALRCGQTVPAHCSPSHVVLTVVEGSGVFRGAEGSVTLGAGDSLLYAPDETHSIHAAAEPLRFLAFITPRPGG